jgi:hypothetical protein
MKLAEFSAAACFSTVAIARRPNGCSGGLLPWQTTAATYRSVRGDSCAGQPAAGMTERSPSSLSGMMPVRHPGSR